MCADFRRPLYCSSCWRARRLYSCWSSSPAATVGVHVIRCEALAQTTPCCVHLSEYFAPAVRTGRLRGRCSRSISDLDRRCLVTVRHISDLPSLRSGPVRAGSRYQRACATGFRVNQERKQTSWSRPLSVFTRLSTRKTFAISDKGYYPLWTFPIRHLPLASTINM